LGLGSIAVGGFSLGEHLADPAKVVGCERPPLLLERRQDPLPEFHIHLDSHRVQASAIDRIDGLGRAPGIGRRWRHLACCRKAARLVVDYLNHDGDAIG
jgi:hypothetical protein